MVHAPVLSFVIAALASLATWKVSQAFHHRHLVIVEAHRDHYKALSESVNVPLVKVDAKGRSAKVERLASLIDEGRCIRHRHGKMEPSWNAELEAWQAKVVDFLRKEMGPQAITKFSDDIGLPEFVTLSMFNPESRHPWLDRQIQNLVDIMENMDFYL